jgi:hypothetical protein
VRKVCSVKVIWAYGEEGSEDIVAMNNKAMQKLAEDCDTCCANPFCKYPLHPDEKTRHSAPGLGDVCDACHYMRIAISTFNGGLRNPSYFKDLHEKWLKEQEEFKNKRRRMGD